jgi:hypothetical protein
VFGFALGVHPLVGGIGVGLDDPPPPHASTPAVTAASPAAQNHLMYME